MILLGGMTVLVSGCVTLETQEEIPIKEARPIKRDGIYHKVRSGETLWRIAKTYNVPIGDITRSNGIPSAAKIEKNQLIFIPGAREAKEITFPTLHWRVMGPTLRCDQHHASILDADFFSKESYFLLHSLVFSF